jgi:hypothetical protein
MITSNRRTALVALVTLWGGALLASETYRIEERLAVGTKYHVRMRVEVSGTLTPPRSKDKAGSPVKFEGTSAIDYDERVLSLDSKRQVDKTLRICAKLDFRRTVAGQPQELSLRPGVRRLVVLRKGHKEVPFSPDGPLTWGEIDAVRTDVFAPALLGLLPGKSVATGDRWSASSTTVAELTDLEKIDEGTLDCKLERVVTAGKKQLARVTFAGTIKGIGEDGAVRHRLQGHYLFDLDAQFLAEVTLLGTTSLIDDDGKDVGKIDGRFVLLRSQGITTTDLSDEAVKRIKVEPDADNTQLLYDNPQLGVRFLHSRRWRIAQVMGAQVALATNEGDGVLVTIDPPERIPKASAFLDESRTWLTKQKARLLKTYSPSRLRERPSLDAFALEAELGKQKVWLDYYVTAQSGGGATIAARLGQEGLAELRREVEKLARSVTITKRITGKAK